MLKKNRPENGEAEKEASSFRRRRRRRLLALFLAVESVLLLAAAEVALRVFFPFQAFTIGHTHSPNALRYGWGLNPGELITLSDPDTGEIYQDRANSRGWRDRERTLENPAGECRILVLGDSVTYGPVVPAEKVYTRVLEDRLQREGYNAEVMNIAYAGWGTDQELEALKEEGLRYAPDLVVIQFCTNDLTDNAYFRAHPEKPSAWKPFYYALGAQGRLERHENPHFARARAWNWKIPAKSVIARSEILKRLYALRQNVSARDVNLPPRPGADPAFSVTARQIEQLRVVLGLEENAPFLVFLKGEEGKDPSGEVLRRAIREHGLSGREAVILRVLERRWFHAYWRAEAYLPKEADPDDPVWQLYFALLREARRLCEEHGAALAILSDNEEGHYAWSRDWGEVKDDEAARRNYLSPGRLVRAFAPQNGIEFVENEVPHARARNDPHPNVAGNEAMAENLHRFLKERHGKELEAHRLPSAALPDAARP
ncbi:MAG: SGNH/GDSL hydrolase family protein [Planctomycetota bacterium]